MGWICRLDTRHWTPFEREVWEIMRTFRFGHTIRVVEILNGLSGSHTREAVAGALLANTKALGIPTHRVVAEGDTLSFSDGENGSSMCCFRASYGSRT